LLRLLLPLNEQVCVSSHHTQTVTSLYAAIPEAH